MLHLPVQPSGRTTRSGGSSLFARVLLASSETPEAPALLSTRERRSYAELAAFAADLGRALRAAGVTPAHRVALLVEGELALAECLLGVSSVAPCLPLSTRMQPSEMSDWLRTCEISVLVVADALRPQAAQLTGDGELPLLVLERQGPGRVSVSGQVRSDRRAPVDAALLLPTSGTTGTPKVIPITRAVQLAGARTVAKALGLTSDDCCLNLMPFHHVGGQFMALFSSWTVGAACVCVDEPGAPDLLAAHAALRPTWLCGVPAQLKRLAEDVPADARALGLRFVHAGAAPLPPATQRDVEAVFGAELVQSYGLTETIMIACNPRGATRPGSVGLPRQALRLLDARGEDVPEGEEGEIAVSGPSVFPGYLTRDGLDRQGFAGAWFRTGDLGRLDRDGRLSITGRARELINRGGEKVFPTRVDAVLEGHPAVREATTFPVPHATLGEDVAAAVQPRDGSALSVEELRAYCAERLGAHECPRHLFVVDALPHNRAGKKDRRALTSMFAAQVSQATTTPEMSRDALVALGKAEARAELERLLVAEVARITGRAANATTPFVELGVDSAGLVELRAAISHWLGQPVPTALIFDQPSAKRLARALCADLFGDAKVVPRSDTQSTLDRPVSYTEANWLVAGEQTHSGVIAEALRVRGPLSTEVVIEALRALQARHPILRVHVQGEGFERRFVERGTLPIPLHEVEIASADWSTYLESTLAKSSFSPGAPLLEVELIRFVDAPSEYGLALRASHAIWDGGSRALVELLELCAAISEGRPVDVLPREPQPHIDQIAARVRGRKGGLNMLLGLLGKSAVQRIPRGSELPPVRTRRASRRISEAELAEIDARAGDQRSRVLSTLAAAALCGIRALLPGDGPLPLTVLWFVDLRSYDTLPALSGALGPYASTVLELHHVARHAEVADLAERCASQLNRALLSGTASILFVPQSRFFRAALRRPRLLRAHGRVSSLAVSDVRTFESLRRQVGPFSVLDTWGLANIHGMGPLMSVYMTRTPFGAEVFAAYPDPLVTESQAQAIVDDVVRALAGRAALAASSTTDGPIPRLVDAVAEHA